MPTAVELDDADRAALIALLKQTIAADPDPDPRSDLPKLVTAPSLTRD